MRYLSFKILIVCILLPPVLYILSVNSLEGYLTSRSYTDVKNIYLSDVTDILSGQVELKESINDSIENYLKKIFLLKIGVQLDIAVTTKTGNILYPSTYQSETPESLPPDPVKLAENNFKILNEGLDIHVDAKIKPYSFLAISILLFYILIFLNGLYIYYRKILARAHREELNRKEELDNLHTLEDEYTERIQSLSDERENLLSNYHQLQQALETEKIQAEKTEEDLFDEVDELEKKLNINLSLQQQQHVEIDKLNEKIREFEKNKETISRQKQKETDKIEKRFKILYKNIGITRRALENLTDMTEEMNLKAEEIIHLLNGNSSAVPVKRKVFSKKGNITAFEVIFAYSGRLYFRKTKENKVEILTIGTKNTQPRDLAFLDSI